MTDTPQTLVDSFLASTDRTASQPKTVTLPDGTFLVAYATKSNSGSGFQIRGQVLDANGNLIGGEILFPFQSKIDDPVFDIAVLPGGNVVISAETDPDSDFIGPDAIGSGDFNPDGTIAAPAGGGARPGQITNTIFELSEDGVVARGSLASDDNDEELLSPTIVGLGEGSFRQIHVAGDGRNERLVMTGFEGGAPIEEIDLGLFQFNGTKAARIDADVLNDGNIVLVVDHNGRGSGGQLEFRIIRPDGALVANGVSGQGASKVFDPTVTALADGGFVIVWAEGGRDTDLIFQMYDANGVATTGRRQAADFGSRDNNNEPALVALQDGGFVLFYDKDAGDDAIRGQRFDSQGDAIGDDFLITTSRAGQVDATLLPDGRVAVSYKLAGNNGIEVEILSLDGDPILGTEGDDSLAGRDGDNRIDVRAGNDLINDLSSDDTIFGGDGDDRIRSGNGNDKIFGGGGDDDINGGAGNDLIEGNAGRDTIDGGFGDDTIFGGGGRDVIDGSEGNDVLFGNRGSDTFIFVDGSGQDEIGDFNANDDNEVIDLSGLSAITDFDDLSENHLSQEGDDAVIDDGAGTTITLRSVNIADLDANDFIF